MNSRQRFLFEYFKIHFNENALGTLSLLDISDVSVKDGLNSFGKICSKLSNHEINEVVIAFSRWCLKNEN
ncbi:hypothetical protein [Liquorilactobacillus nagelii]|uniref:hypothetical protein n=1 Tax=Liquorilactobacillus nagelii TaxID=82688 RepID=UPI001CCF032A|nr:hypothetical protein [Liquorilactobacillus nagelii]ULQ49042.1 hypothetical protein J6864_08740 [Liquorilactobacillus nagelii]